MAHLADLTIVRGSKEQLLVSRQRQATAWARGMSEEQFIDREVQLEKFAHATDGKMICWVLVPRNDPHTLEFKCSCETFRRLALVVKQSSPPEKVIAYGIASVFCPPENRNKGYASHMMRLLHHILAPAESLPPFPKEWGTPPPSYPGIGKDARLSMLYSYVGDFYRSCGPSPDTSGWHVLGAVSTTWKLNPEDLIHSDVSDESYYFLSEEQCVNLWESDAAYITECMSQLPASTRTRFTCLPNNGVAAYFIHRAMAEAPLHPKHPLEHWGVAVRLQEHERSPSAYATWGLDMYLSKPPSIIVTRLRASPDSLPALVKGLIRVAGQIGADSIEVWNLDTKLVDVAESLGGHTAARDDNFSAVAWYGPEKPDEIEWAFNEKHVFFFFLRNCSLGH